MEDNKEIHGNKHHEEYQYLNIIKHILENGFWEEGRNGKTKNIFGDSMRFSLKDGKIRIYVEAWKQSFKIRLTTVQRIKEGDTLRLKMYYDPEKANWKDKMVFQLVHINSVASTNYQE